MSFWTASTNRMVIDSDGSVSIGPQASGTSADMLQVSSSTSGDGIMLTGDGTASGMSSGNYRRIGFRYDDTDTSYSSEIRFVIPVSGTHGGAIDFLTHQSATTALNSRLYIDQYGNIKTVDGANFYNKSDGWYGTITYNGSLRGYIGSDRQIFAGGSEANMGYMATGDSVFGAGSTEKLRIQNSAQSLRIKGGSVTGSNYMQFVNSAGTSQGYFGYGGGSDTLYITQQVAGDIAFYTNSAVRGSISQSGTLTMGGDVVAYGSPSDKRLKENIKPIESALDKVCKLQGVTFDWKKSDSILEIKEDIGFIAQDVQKVIPPKTPELLFCP